MPPSTQYPPPPAGGSCFSATAATLLAQLADTPSPPGTTGISLDMVMARLIPLTGWPRAEFLTRLLGDLASSANLPVIERALLRQEAGDFAPFALTLRGLSGPVHVQITARPLGDYGVIAALLTPFADELTAGTEHTERSRLLNLLDRLPGYVILLGPDHIIRYENRAFRQIFGPGCGKPCYEVMRGSNTSCAFCPPCDVFETRTLCVNDWATKDNGFAFRSYSYPFEDVDGSPLVLQLGIDITAGVRAMEALYRSEERYRSITDNLAQGVAVLDNALRIEAANPRMTEWFGAEAAAGISLCRLLHDFCGDANTHCGDCPVMHAFRDGCTHQRTIQLRLSGEEDRRIFRLQACSMPTPPHGPRAVVIMLDDETDRIKVEMQLTRARRMEALGTLATGVAHEINQPLSALRLYASGLEMLLEKRPDISRATLLERLSRILQEADRIREIIEHMRGLVTQGMAHTRPTDVAAASHEALRLVKPQLDAHGIRVETAFTRELPPVLAVPVQLEQAIINLVINAMHALDSTQQDDKRIRLAAACTGEVVLVTVEDNGPGIGDLGDRIFDPFFTTKDAHKGMGLGLALVHNFLEAWGGSVTIETPPPPAHGTVFMLTLRVVPGLTPHTSPPDGACLAHIDR